MKFAELFLYYGLWVPIISFIALNIWSFSTMGVGPPIDILISVEGLACACALSIWSKNSIAKKNGKKHFDLLPLSEKDPYYQVNFRWRALFDKRPPDSMLFRKPRGIVYGRKGVDYVCAIPGIHTAHTLILGPTGAGKTSSIIACMVLARRFCRNNQRTSLISIDVKGEIYQKFLPKDDSVLVFNPEVRSNGFDVFYDIRGSDISQDMIMTAITRVTNCLIPMKENGDKFWVASSRNVLSGIFAYAWLILKTRDLISMIDLCFSKPLNELISEILDCVDSFSVVARLLNPYSGEAAETIHSIAMNLSSNLYLWQTSECLRFNFRDASEMINVKDALMKGQDIDFIISDRHLEQYAIVLNLCLSTCAYCLSSPDREQIPNLINNQVILLVDEWSRISCSAGRLDFMVQLLQIGRSRGVTVMAACQSFEPIKATYGESIASDILTNFTFKTILGGDSKETYDMATRAFGKFLNIKKSLSYGKQNSNSFSYGEEDILTQEDIITLPDKNRMILISPQGAFMLQKLQYFKDKFFKRASSEANIKRMSDTNNDKANNV